MKKGNRHHAIGSSKRKSFAFALGTLLFAVCFSAHAQQAKSYSVVVLVIGSSEIPQIKGLRDGLKELGYNQGKNLSLDVSAKSTYEELRPLVKSYKEKKVDVMVTIGGTATVVVKEIAPEIPTVFSFGSDPVQAGFVDSIARPGSNLTGVTTRTGPEFQGKRLEIFKEAVPTLRRATVLYNARGDNPGHEMNLNMLRQSAPKLDIKLIAKPIKVISDLDNSLQTLSRETTDGVFVIAASIFRTRFNKIVPAATEKKLPVLGAEAFHVIDDGALLFYDSDRFRIGQRLAWYVDRILKGTKPQDLPVEAPTYFELMINLKTAKQIGITIPPSVLARADRVIK
ncbi:MAG TPA: ABC transporter substrate-binding protein [Candidatus Binatia bacterium]|nr:ABC transporter substrate-binding protein [Candidatus Binatia bacterium]